MVGRRRDRQTDQKKERSVSQRDPEFLEKFIRNLPENAGTQKNVSYMTGILFYKILLSLEFIKFRDLSN